jgi:Ca2+-binding RTX toxin-like protein
MPIFNVSNAAELTNALASAQGGDRIILAAGNYGDLRLTNRSYSGGQVEIVSADPANPAQFRTVFLTNVSNLAFKSVEIGYTLAPGEPNWAKYANIERSSHLTFDGVHFRGSLDNDSSNDGNGLSVLNSSHIKVLNSEFQQLGRGLMMGSTTDIEVRNNRFHDMRSDGADFADAQRVLVAGNHFTNFYPVGADHPDAIQFWTYGTTRASSDIVIRDNVILQGQGRGLQGIFLKDEVGTLPYERVVIGNNLVYVNDGLNGITIQGGRGAVIQNNTVVSQRGDAYSHYIRMEDVNGLVLKDNVMDTFVNVRNSNLYQIDNVRLDQNPGRIAELRDLQAGAAATVEGLTLPGTAGYRPEGTPPLLNPPRIGDGATNVVVLGGTLTANDFIDLKEGRDAIGLQGNYPALTLGQHNLLNVETLAILSGSDTRFGETGTNRYSYNITTVDENVAAGQRLTVNAFGLLPGESFTFNGAAERDGSFFVYGGRGVDTLTGGANTDLFYFSTGAFNPSDRIDGGGGTDAVGFRGDFSGANAIVLTADNLVNIETIAFSSQAETRFAQGGSVFGYALTTHDATVGAGRIVTINGGQLLAGETMIFDGSNESDGAFRIFAGASDDIIIGGSGADFIQAGRGRDIVTGGAGADTFQLRNPGDSSGAACDQLIGFDCRADRIDVAGNFGVLTDILDRGALSLASFDADLAVALGGLLGGGEAALFTADAGDMAGRNFLVIDGNGQAGYQAGQDYVLELVNPLVPINPGIDFLI